MVRALLRSRECGMEVSFWTSPFSVYATPNAQQLEHSAEPSQKHFLIVFCHTPPGSSSELKQVFNPVWCIPDVSFAVFFLGGAVVGPMCLH